MQSYNNQASSPDVGRGAEVAASGEEMSCKLAEFSDDELFEEIVRRRNGDDEGNRGDIQFCDQCDHFVPWSDGSAVPPQYNPCSFGHDLHFRTPVGYTDDWGFFLRVCAVRLERKDDAA